MNKILKFVFLTIFFEIIVATSKAQNDSIVGEWIWSEDVFTESLVFGANGACVNSMTTARDFSYQLIGSNMVSRRDDGYVNHEDVSLNGSTLLLKNKEDGDVREFHYADGVPQAGLIGKWTGHEFYQELGVTVQEGVSMEFLTNGMYYVSLFSATTGKYEVTGRSLKIAFDQRPIATHTWKMKNDILTITTSFCDHELAKRHYKRKNRGE